MWVSFLDPVSPMAPAAGDGLWLVPAAPTYSFRLHFPRPLVACSLLLHSCSRGELAQADAHSWNGLAVGPRFFFELIIMFEDATELSPPLKAPCPRSFQKIWNYARNRISDAFPSERLWRELVSEVGPVKSMAFLSLPEPGVSVPAHGGGCSARQPRTPSSFSGSWGFLRGQPESHDVVVSNRELSGTSQTLGLIPTTPGRLTCALQSLTAFRELERSSGWPWPQDRTPPSLFQPWSQGQPPAPRTSFLFHGTPGSLLPGG